MAGDRALKVAVVGCGVMGTALLKGWLTSDACCEHSFSASVRSQASLDRLQRELSAFPEYVRRVSLFKSTADHLSQISKSDVVVLGMLPTQLDSILRGTPGLVAAIEGKLVVSLLAGITPTQVLDMISSASEDGKAAQVLDVVCAIPTIGCTIGESVTLLATHRDDASSVGSLIAHGLFEAVGSVVRVPEHLMLSATSIGAVAHAVCITVIDSMADASAAKGVPRSTAMAIAAASFKSAGSMFSLGNYTPASMKEAMSTPKGITMNAIVDLDVSVRAGVAGVVKNAIDYAEKMNE